MSAISRQGIVAELARRVALVGVADVDEPMRRAGQHLGGGLAGPDVQVPEHLRRVHADDLEGTTLGEGHRDRGLAGRGRTHQEDDGSCPRSFNAGSGRIGEQSRRPHPCN